MQIELIPISKLKLLEKNPRRITKEQMTKLCKSIKDDPEFLSARPILVNMKPIDTGGSEYIVYAGNQRVRAAKKLKMKEIPCILEYDIPEDILNKRIILDNKSFGEWDFDLLANEWEEELLINCGFLESEFVGSEEKKEKEDKQEKKTKNCPHCGNEI